MTGYELAATRRDQEGFAGPDSSGTGLDVDFERLDLSATPTIVRNMEYIRDAINDLSKEQERLQEYGARNARRAKDQLQWRQERQAENARRRDAGEPLLADEPNADHPLFAPTKAEDVPNRLEAILLNKQIGAYCDQINDVALEALDKLKLAGHLRNTTD